MIRQVCQVPRLWGGWPAAVTALLALASGAGAQTLSCSASAPVPDTVRSEGLAEPVGDIILNCTGGTPGPSMPIQVTVSLNTNLTSRTYGTSAIVSEASLLIDEPQPDVVNMSNGFPYNGQVLGKQGIAAGAAGSGNVYLGRQSSPTSVTWSGIPIVAPGSSGTRILRLTNLRANATTISGSPGFVMATISATIPVTPPTAVLAFVTPGLNFSATVQGSTVNLQFAENFVTDFKPRISTGTTGPFSMSRQDIPGALYETESQFTPCFSYGKCSTTPPSTSIGRANSGTRLQTQMSGLGSSAAFLSVPNQVTDTASGAEAYLLVSGKPVMNPGSTSLTVTNGRVGVTYDVTAANPFALAVLVIPATLLDSSSTPLAFPSTATFKGQLAPTSSTGTASSTAPEPRFMPQ